MPIYREAILFSVQCDPPALLWSGAGDLIIDGQTYLGSGELLGDIPEIQQLINGVAQRVDFSVSGVDQETLRLATEDRASVNGAVVRLGTIMMDEAWQIIGDAEWEWEGVADIVTIDRTGDEAGNVTRVVSLSVGSEDTARSKLNLSFYTDADQRRKYPTDAIFSHVAGITLGATRRFGAAT